MISLHFDYQSPPGEKKKIPDTEMSEKLTKKQKKALQFKKGAPKEELAVKNDTETETETAPKKRKREEEKPAKKRAPPRFILFVGNLPYDLKEEDLQEHFKTANPSNIRMRKGFAFMEFEGDEASKNLHLALRFHHSTLKYRKINVELTAGGGGNSAKRRKKLDQKNAALQDELTERIEIEKKTKLNSKSKANPSQNSSSAAPADFGKIHPDRLKKIKK